jgi:hypothetical protein
MEGAPETGRFRVASYGWRGELALRIALAILPCAVLLLRVPAVLGRTTTSWIVPLTMTFANAFLAVSIARQALTRKGFLAFWAIYGLLWSVVAWHGFHFHGPPRPAALLLNLREISQTPLPGWAEVPWASLAGALGLAWVARWPAAASPHLRRATAVAMLAFVALHSASFFRYRTRDTMRLSAYTELVRTHGLEVAIILDALALSLMPDTAGVLDDLRRDVASRPPRSLPLEPVAADRIVLVQLESLDREAFSLEATPNLLRLWSSTTHGLVDPQRTSVSGSAGADFQLLTGLRPAAGIPVFRIDWDRDRSGLPAIAASVGFEFHVYHGNDRHFWNRDRFLAAMGATFHSSDAIPQTESTRWGRTDGDLFRHAGAQIRKTGRAVHFLITPSTHAPFDLLDSTMDVAGLTLLERYLRSVAYLDEALGAFLASLPREGTTLVFLYGDHSSGLFGPWLPESEPAVPMILGSLGADGSLAPLQWQGHEVGAMPDVYELPSLHRYIKDCLDASAR